MKGLREVKLDKEFSFELMNGNCIEKLRELPENSIDTCITDPPYHLTGKSNRKGFMGKEWDGGDISFRKETWEEVYRVLKPGGMCVVFGGERTFHRIAVAIEDAGFEIRNILAYMYGSGFPKSLNIGIAVDKLQGNERVVIDDVPDHVAARTQGNSEWEGYFSGLKPAYEPIIVGMKPLDGTFAENALKWGVAGYNLDRSRIPHNEPEKKTFRQKLDGDVFNADNCGFKCEGAGVSTPNQKGRYPATVIHDGSDEVISRLPTSKSSANVRRNTRGWGDGVVFHKSPNPVWGAGYEDEGSVARFFYCAKASKKERHIGLDGTGLENGHPTLKPLKLMSYLARITRTPRGGTVLDPFMGSGTTGMACAIEQRSFIGIELEPEYFELAKTRIEYAFENTEALKEYGYEDNNKNENG